MKKLALLVVLIGSNAAAQPGADAPYPEPPPVQQPPQPYPPPQQPPPVGYAVPVQLTPDQLELLQKGEISDGQHVGGAVASVFLGFGIGQAVQGRYGETGWIFTVGEIASFTALVVGVSRAIGDCFNTNDSCNDNNSGGEGLIIGGLVGLLVFRVWEVVDAFGGPPKHNRKVRELKMRLGMPVYTQRMVPYVNRTRDNGATAGLVFHF